MSEKTSQPIMHERISALEPFNYDKLLEYLKQFPSVTFASLGDTANFYAHLRTKARNPVRDLDGLQTRVLFEKLGIKVYIRNNDAPALNWGYRCDNYIKEIPDDSLILAFPTSNFFAGPNGPQYPWVKKLLESGRPFLWYYSDVRMNPTNKQFTRHFPELPSKTKTIGLQSACDFQINYNVDLVKFTDKQPSIEKFCYIGGNRGDLKKRMRCFKPENTSCYGMIDKWVEFGDDLKFYFEYELAPNRLVDAYSTYYATVFTTSACTVLTNLTPRLYETLCSNAVVFFDVASELDDFIDMPLTGYESDWEFRKVRNADEADKKLKEIINNPDLRKQLVENQHKYIEMLDKHVSGI